MKKITFLFLMVATCSLYAQTPVTPPYTNDFNEAIDTANWKLENPSGKGEWVYSDSYFGIAETGSFVFIPTTSTPSDNWLFSAPFDLAAGVDYSLDFKYTSLTHNGTATNLSVSIGTQAASLSMTTEIFNLDAYTVSDFTLSHNIFTVPVSGTYYIGFHDEGSIGGMNGGQTFDDLSITGTTGIAQQSDSKIAIYPNPASNVLNICNNEAATISLYNVQGALVRSIQSTDLKTSVDVSDLDAGIYVVKVITAKSIFVEQVILVD